MTDDHLTEADRALCDEYLRLDPSNRVLLAQIWVMEGKFKTRDNVHEFVVCELSRQLAAAEADAARLAEALGDAQHFMERAFADPDSLKDRLSTMDCFADQLGRNRDALAAHTARLING